MRGRLPPWPSGERRDLVCPECRALMVLRWTDRFERWFYGCSRWPQCSATHGAHPDGRPLGVPADRKTKDARIAAHAAFDALWKPLPGRGWRGAAYGWLRRQLGMTRDECHIGQFDAETCERVIRACDGWGPERFRDHVEAIRRTRPA